MDSGEAARFRAAQTAVSPQSTAGSARCGSPAKVSVRATGSSQPRMASPKLRLLVRGLQGVLQLRTIDPGDEDHGRSVAPGPICRRDHAEEHRARRAARDASDESGSQRSLPVW